MNKNIIIGIVIASVLVLNTFVLKPFFEKRSAVKLGTKILNLWEKGDLPKVYDFWLTPETTPPLYGVTSYDILDVFFYKENKEKLCEISVILNFTDGNMLESGREWKLILVKTNRRWFAKNLLKLD